MRSILQLLTRNIVTLIGAALTTVSSLVFLTLFVLDLFGFHGGPYVGIIVFVVMPALFVLGLILIPIGGWMERLSKGGAAEKRLPVIDLNSPRFQRLLIIFVAATTVNLIIISIGTYKAVEVMDSTDFCAKSCHVMNPEFTAYSHSPHSRVGCVECHIGTGASWFVRSKLSGTSQLFAVTFNTYPRPIPTPVHNLRPARETCEECHWPTKFVGDRLKVISHFTNDEKTKERKTVLLMNIGGTRGGKAQGIHWHVDPGIQVRYKSDPKREKISEVELTRGDQTKAYKVKASNATASNSEGEWRVMDCVDCHNRPTHIYSLPAKEVDAALAGGRLDKELPFIRRESIQALEVNFPSAADARAGLSKALKDFYEKSYPDVTKARSGQIDAAVKTVQDIYASNVFPEMRVEWGTYPSFLGHQENSGCLRCHDGDHVADSGEKISKSCDRCHTTLAVEEENPDILQALYP
jgi:hypothetical protein